MIPALGWGVGTSVTKAIIGALITLASAFAGGFGLGRRKKVREIFDVISQYYLHFV